MTKSALNSFAIEKAIVSELFDLKKRSQMDRFLRSCERFTEVAFAVQGRPQIRSVRNALTQWNKSRHFFHDRLCQHRVSGAVKVRVVHEQRGEIHGRERFLHREHGNLGRRKGAGEFA